MHVPLLKTLSVLVVALSCGATPHGLAAPSLKPDLGGISKLVSAHDATELRQGLNAVELGNWSQVRRIEARLVDQTARQILTWYRARRDVRMSFSELTAALDELQGWPEINNIRATAEDRISTSGLSDADIVAWFSSHGGPSSGVGHLNFARALAGLGNPDQALSEIRTAWHGRTLSQSLSQQIYRDYRTALTQEDHRQRADFLLWTRQTGAAARMKPLLTQDWQNLVDARIRLIRRQGGVDRAIAAVPTALRAHPGLLFDRAQWRRRSGMTSRVSPLLRDIDGHHVPLSGRGRLWDERNMAVRRALKDADWELAYELAAPHGLDAGVDFAEAEWMAGWVALQHLGDADLALRHFSALEAGVDAPISEARALYWKGRAEAALGHHDRAREAYLAASAFGFTYYGQLAAEKVDQSLINLPVSQAASAADRDAFMRRPLVRALVLFAENGWDALFRKFAYHLDDQLETPQDFELLAELGRQYHYSDIGVRAAKVGLAKGVVAADAAYPVVDYPLLREPTVERSLMLALSRQESEMNPGAISHANARGLMQFIPRTARLEARRQGLPYRTSWLTDDPGYNMTLGGAHLDTLLDQFNGSYIMTTAAYNAGASRPRRWVSDYGDPRAGEVDPIDWVEFIPFSETRNYVQRVLENTQVYRHRLTGQPVSVQLSEDLQRGRFAN
jgi:soluble lytic murein transglycosylase